MSVYALQNSLILKHDLETVCVYAFYSCIYIQYLCKALKEIGIEILSGVQLELQAIYLVKYILLLM